jgi:hypothetical protein
VWAQEKSSEKSSFFCEKCLDSVNGARVQWGIPRGYPLPPPRGGGGGSLDRAKLVGTVFAVLLY